jgi:hypothetical protein
MRNKEYKEKKKINTCKRYPRLYYAFLLCQLAHVKALNTIRVIYFLKDDKKLNWILTLHI